MAVTTGPFATIARTFSTRGEFTGQAYSLDLPLSQTGHGVALEDVADFVAGYLNASRLGQARLEEALQEAGTERAMHRRWVPNACDECPHQDTCHAAFDTSREGFGLYPFNAPALDRAVESRSPKNNLTHGGSSERSCGTHLISNEPTSPVATSRPARLPGILHLAVFAPSTLNSLRISGLWIPWTLTAAWCC